MLPFIVSQLVKFSYVQDSINGQSTGLIHPSSLPLLLLLLLLPTIITITVVIIIILLKPCFIKTKFWMFLLLLLLAVLGVAVVVVHDGIVVRILVPFVVVDVTVKEVKVILRCFSFRRLSERVVFPPIQKLWLYNDLFVVILSTMLEQYIMCTWLITCFNLYFVLLSVL